MKKVSAEQAAQVLAAVGPTLRKLAAERDAAVEKAAVYERKAAAEKVAAMMIEKGATTDTYEDVVLRMEKAAQTTNPEGINQLEVIRAGLELSGPNMGEKIARIVDRYDYVGTGEHATTAFDQFILGGM